MLSSPAKRRKTSPTKSSVINASNNENEAAARESATTPTRRRSFQSPTKASLARFNPGLLPRSQPSALTKPALDRLENAATEADAIRARRVALFERSMKRPHGASTVVTDVLQDAVNEGNVQNTPADGTSTKQKRKRQSIASHSPLRNATAPSKFDGDGSLLSLDFQDFNAHSTPEVAREYVGQGSIASRSSSRQRYNELDENGEPELPPTPVDLGLEERAPPPSGKLSSSSPSGRSARKRRRRHFSTAKSSPLKPRAGRPRGKEDQGVALSLADVRPKVSNVSEAVLQKLQIKDGLASQLAKLKEEVEKLETEAKRSQNDRQVDEETERELITLLTSSNPSCAPKEPTPVPPSISAQLSWFLPFAPTKPAPAPKETTTSSSVAPLALDNIDHLPYLNLFNPLVFNFNTFTSMTESGRLSQIHTLTLSSPAPFSDLSLSLKLAADPATHEVLTLECTSIPSSKGGNDRVLHDWVDRRLKNPIFSKDMGGIGFTLGRYWEAVVERAEVWKQIGEDLPQLSANATVSGPQLPAKALQPYIGLSSMLFKTSTGQNSTITKAILVNYDISLSNWTGQVQKSVGICVSGFGWRVEEPIKTAFAGMVRKLGVSEAVKGIVSMVLGNE